MFFETQRGIIESLFGWRGDDAELAQFDESLDITNTSIIVADGEYAGWITVQRAEHIELDGIYLKPTMQRRGIGTALIRALIAEAQTTCKPLRLSTAKINPARRLYERIGFIDVSETEYKVFMEWQPKPRVVRIERPSAELAQSFAAMREAFIANREDHWTNQDQALAHSDPVAFAKFLRDVSEGRNLPPNRTAFDAFWIVLDNEVVGECDIRHPLTPKLEAAGGHIGYDVHPAYRNQGIAAAALREALRILAAKGVADALVTCAHDNAASIRVIEKCGGRRIEDTTRRRYLIPTSEKANPAQ